MRIKIEADIGDGIRLPVNYICSSGAFTISLPNRMPNMPPFSTTDVELVEEGT